MTSTSARGDVAVTGDVVTPPSSAAPASPRPRGSRWLDGYDPEDPAF